MKKNVTVCALSVCLLLFSGCSLAGFAASDDKVISETAANDGAFVLTEYDTRVTCECDLDKDGDNEIITADYSQTLKDHQLPINMNVSESDGEAILWQDMSLGLVSMGEKSYYVTALDGSVYLMEYHPPKDRQGLYDYSLKVFSIDKRGNEVIYVQISGEGKEEVDEFNKQIAQYMDNAYLIISTEDGNIMTSRLVLRGD